MVKEGVCPVPERAERRMNPGLRPGRRHVNPSSGAVRMWLRPSRLGLVFHLDRFDPGALDPRRLDACRYFGARCIGRARRLRRMQRARTRHRARHQHAAAALMPEIAIGETHARHRTAKTAFGVLDQIEARLERKALQRRAHRLTANLQRIAGKPDMAHRAGACELHGAGGATVIENAACAAGAIEAGECEHLARHEPAGFIGIHRLPGQSGRNHRGGENGPQHKTRKHA